jgi:hypothetical protein
MTAGEQDDRHSRDPLRATFDQVIERFLNYTRRAHRRTPASRA